MPELQEQLYCSQQIVIPPKFPYVLKKFAKAAIKTQPYDLLRWAMEYFVALAEDRIPPVKTRLEYPIFNTEGGLSRGYLKILVKQLEGCTVLCVSTVENRWKGSCLELEELRRILCLCDALYADKVDALKFFAVAAGMLTKSLTQTMLLTCELLTNEPDGGSASVPVSTFLDMYTFLARIDAAADVKYINGVREGTDDAGKSSSSKTSDDDDVAQEEMVVEGEPESTVTEDEEHDEQKDKKGGSGSQDSGDQGDEAASGTTDKKTRHTASTMSQGLTSTQASYDMRIAVFDEDNNEIPLVIDEPETVTKIIVELDERDEDRELDEELQLTVKEQVALVKKTIREKRAALIADVENCFDEIEDIAKFIEFVSYDLGVITGRQMSATSGEFVVNAIEREIWTNVEQQIALLPDPSTRKRKATPAQVLAVRGILDDYIRETLEVIIPDQGEEEEIAEEDPDVVMVYAIPGIGPTVDEAIIEEFTKYAREAASGQAECIMPRNLRHFLCPPLEKYLEQRFDSPTKE